jgi:phenylpyruvate tautomerase PptA (4-oxalocrotonate tautomerase family)
MPHLTVHVLESDLAGRETSLIASLTEAVVAVYGEWARELTVVQLIGLPAGRWGIGGRPAEHPAPSVTFGIKEGAFHRPDSPEIVARLIAGVTDAIASVLGDQVRPGVSVELVGTLPGRTGIGGTVAA